jgi:signal transduction histidine kinase
MSHANGLGRITRAFLQMGLPPGADAELARKASIALGFSVIGIVFLVLLGILAVFHGILGLIIVDFTAAAVLTANLIYINRSKNISAGSHIGVYTIGVAYVFFLASGGEANTAYVWYFTFPLISFFLLGYREGGFVSAILLASAGIIFLFGDRFAGIAVYPTNFKIRFTAAFLVVCLFSYFFELFREGSLKELAAQNLRLQEKMEELARKEAELEEANRKLVQEIDRRRRVQQDLATAKEQAVQANLAKSEFLANMSHELRTPLNHIIGFSELLSKERLGPLQEEQKAHLRDVVKSGRHLLSLINDVLDLAKIESGRVDLDLGPVDVRAMLEQAMTTIRELAATKNLRLSLHCEPLSVTVILDERRIKQVLFNLLSNAVKFTDAGGSVELSCKLGGTDPRASFVEFAVKDSGIGISLEDQSRLFERFVRLESQMDRSASGTGLGLALCRHLVELHGGEIWVESAGAGEGTAFTFVIPLG